MANIIKRIDKPQFSETISDICYFCANCDPAGDDGIRGGIGNQSNERQALTTALCATEKKLFSNVASNKYLVLNFSKLPNPEPILRACGIEIADIISYTYISGEKTLDFFRCLSNSFCRCNVGIIYFANNFTQVKNNILWFKYRKGTQDLIIDLSGNVVQTDSLIKSCR